MDSNSSRKKSTTSTGGGGGGGGVLLPWDRFSYWVHSILVVTFDIEMGQSIEAVYPAGNHAKLSANDKTNICYMSFPDSNSGVLGDTQYHFRFKQDHHGMPSTAFNSNSTVAANLNNLTLTTNPTWSPSAAGIFNYDEYNRRTLSGFEVDRNYMFGYVFFRQVKDKTLKRGYFQKSVVLLSRFPFVSLFNYILSLIAVDYFSTGAEVIETACHDIDKWPFPLPGEVISMPILGHLIEICFPVKFDKYTLPVIYKKEYPSIPVSLPPAHEVNLYRCLQPIILHIHLIWELILLNQPILVIANVPSVCSEMSQALISTIWPLKYASDYRPFFTIHNTEFSEYSSKNTLPPGLVIGVTNPFFTKCLQHWPNIIKIGELTNKPATSKQLENSNDSLDSAPTGGKVKKTSSIKDLDSKPVVYTNLKPYLKRDKTFLKSLIRGAEANRPFEAQSALLRRHFMDLTQCFIIPLERYFSGLLPLHKTISPFKSVPKLKEFDPEDFLKNLKQAGPDLAPRLKGDWPGLYKNFFDTLNFNCWLEQKKLEAERKLELLQIELLAGCDINKWLQGRQEIEIIDQFINVRNKLDMVNSCKIETSEQIKQKLRSILDTFLNALPEDVRNILNKNNNAN